MQDMDIHDMNILDETENDSGILAEDHMEDEDKFDEEHDFRTLESEDEARAIEVRNSTLKVTVKVLKLSDSNLTFYTSWTNVGLLMGMKI